jgi:hypothetical protein
LGKIECANGYLSHYTHQRLVQKNSVPHLQMVLPSPTFVHLTNNYANYWLVPHELNPTHLKRARASSQRPKTSIRNSRCLTRNPKRYNAGKERGTRESLPLFYRGRAQKLRDRCAARTAEPFTLAWRLLHDETSGAAGAR